MKALTSVTATFLKEGSSKSNIKALIKLLLFLIALVVLYSVVFHELMRREGQTHSILTGVYWTLTVMTTLGFGDITFHSDIGRIFSIVVLCSGVVFMLVLLPFTFIEFFYAPWVRRQAENQAPRQLPKGECNHVILTQYDEVAAALIPMLREYGHHYWVLCDHIDDALALHSRGIRVMVGDHNDPETYKRMRIETAAMLVTSRGDELNTSITFLTRELAPEIPIVATASSSVSRDVLELAGATTVLRLEDLMGATLARRILIRDSDAHEIGNLHGLVIAEASAANSRLAGQSLAGGSIRARTGVNIIGVWRRGELGAVDPNEVIGNDTMFVLAGTEEQVDRFNRTFFSHNQLPVHVLIIGGGRVGRSTYQHLKELGIEHVTVIERNESRVDGIPGAVIGDARDVSVLKQAGARDATSLIITTHDDDTNVALTIFFRKLRSSWKILTRCASETHVPTMLRAGADLVLSYASMGANVILNTLRGSDHLLLAEGVNVFPARVPESMAGRRLMDLKIRTTTGCTVIAVEDGGVREVNPPPDRILPAGGRLFLIGTRDAESRFLKQFKPPVELSD